MEKPLQKQKIRKELIENIGDEIASFLHGLEEKYELSPGQSADVLNRARDKLDSLKQGIEEISIPSCIFGERRLSSLEVIAKYMRENLGMKYSTIASEMNRSPGTIGITYRNAKNKMRAGFRIKEGIIIPISIFTNRRLSVLENIVSYLKKKGMSLHEIAVLMNRDDRTIWTVSHRAELKTRKIR